MKTIVPALLLGVAGLLAASLPGCGDGASKADAEVDGAGSNLVFSVAACQATMCDGAAALCSWGSQDQKYLACLTNCGLVGIANAGCPEKVSALWTCVTTDIKNVDCTTGASAGCAIQEQAVAGCLLGVLDAGRD